MSNEFPDLMPGPSTRPNTNLEGDSRFDGGAALRVAWLAVVLVSCGGGEGIGRDSTMATWPAWQRIEAGQPPSAWQVEEASLAFDAWEATAVVAQLSFTADLTAIRFVSGQRDSLDVRLAAVPFERFPPTMLEGDTVRVVLIRREGFEGVAQGLSVYNRFGRLLLLYDDGGYGPAFHDAGARAGVTVERALRGMGATAEWESREVTFQLDGDALVLAEGQSARLGNTGFVCEVVVSREWTGPPMTDVDLNPLAYVVFHTGDQ